MPNHNKINVGDYVRVLTGSHKGEIATVGNIIQMSDRLGPYQRFHLTYEGGKVAYRSTGSVEKVTEEIK